MSSQGDSTSKILLALLGREIKWRKNTRHVDNPLGLLMQGIRLWDSLLQNLNQLPKWQCPKNLDCSVAYSIHWFLLSLAGSIVFHVVNSLGCTVLGWRCQNGRWTMVVLFCIKKRATTTWELLRIIEVRLVGWLCNTGRSKEVRIEMSQDLIYTGSGDRRRWKQYGRIVVLDSWTPGLIVGDLVWGVQNHHVRMKPRLWYGRLIIIHTSTTFLLLWPSSLPYAASKARQRAFAGCSSTDPSLSPSILIYIIIIDGGK